MPTSDVLLGSYNFNIFCKYRNPEASRHPSFEALRSLLLGDKMMLLQWSDRDKGVHSDVMLLGADFDVSQGLYTDLQLAYNMS